MICLILVYGIGITVGLVGVCLIPSRPTFTNQVNESLEQASARATAEYNQTVINSVSVKLCFAGCGFLIVGMLVHLRRCYMQYKEMPVAPMPLPRVPAPVPRAPAPAPVLQKVSFSQESPPAQLHPRPVIQIIPRPHINYEYYPPNWQHHT